MTTEEFKAYQKSLNRIRENKLKESPLPKAKQLLEPEIKIKIDTSDLSIDNLPINIPEPVHPVTEYKPTKSESKSLF